MYRLPRGPTRQKTHIPQLHRLSAELAQHMHPPARLLEIDITPPRRKELEVERGRTPTSRAWDEGGYQASRGKTIDIHERTRRIEHAHDDRSARGARR